MGQQRHGYFHSEPCVHFRGTNISMPNIYTVVSASGNTTNLDSHYILDACDNIRVAQYTVIQHQHNLDMGVPASANLYYSDTPSSSTGVLRLPLNHRASDQLSGSSTFQVSRTYKGINADGIRGNYQHFNASTSSSVAPPNARYTDGVASIDIESFSLPQYRGNGLPSPVEVGPHGSSWSRSVSPSALNVNESSLENASMGLQRYHDIARNRSGIRFPHPPPFNPQYHNFHHPTLPMQRMRGHSVNFHPPAASYRVPTIPTENDFEMGARHVGAATSIGLPAHRPHRGVMHEATLGHRNLPPMGFIRLDDVALLVDHHRGLRLDIEDMSYEELLALGERIGNVSTCLSEERITAQMKTKPYSIPTTAINLEVTSEDICIICQDEYKIREKIGILQCGHEYHADCLKNWLLVKNVCPICKSEALTLGGKGV